MTVPSRRARIWGWFFFDWASQPYNTLLVTFMFSGLYVAGSAGLWFAAPQDFNLVLTLALFALGLIGMEFATIFTNSMLPDLGPREEIGRISGNGWAFGYLGGLVALVLMLGFFAESAATGKTFLGLDPAFGLDAGAREGTRFVGPLTALWFIVFMVPFFVYVRDPRPVRPVGGAAARAMKGLGRTLRNLPRTPSLFAYLGSSMFYRDALNGMYTFGGIYAAGVLGWSVVDTGIFGIIAIIAGAVFAWIGGRADAAFGPKPVITAAIVVLTLVAVSVVFVSRDSVFGLAVSSGSRLPDLVFYCLGATIGAAGGTKHMPPLSLALRLAPDVIFFLTDADEPRMTDAELDTVRTKLNRGTVIHAIEFGAGPDPGRDNFIRRLARENGGKSVYVNVLELE